MTTTTHNLENLIVGLGPTGLSVARHLGRKGIDFAVTDSRAEPPGMADLRDEFPEAPCQFGAFDREFFKTAQRIIVSPGVAVATPEIHEASERGAEIVGDIELFVREAQAPIIAITGSNGKSSVTKLVELMTLQAGMQCYAIGNIGRFVLDVLNDPVPDLYVMELSSFQLETTHSLQAVAATVLNISEDHMDRYDGQIAKYAAAKAVVYQGCQHAILNRDDAMVMQMKTGLSLGSDAQVVSFGLSIPENNDFGVLEFQGKRYLACGERRLLPVSEMRLPGDHNVINALAALALGSAAGIPEAGMLEALKQFPGLPHRTEWIRERDGVNWFNDSKGTNVGATAAALQGLPGKTVLIAGGQGKGADFTPLTTVVRDHARAVVLIGEDADLIAKVISEQAQVQHASNMEEAVVMAAELAQSGDNVLLSPACASFDMFRNYIERGNHFAELVRRLPV